MSHNSLYTTSLCDIESILGKNPKVVARNLQIFSMTKFYNVVTRKTINQAAAHEKHIYHKVGVIKITDNGGWFLQLYQQPETDFMIFPNHKEELPVIDFGEHEA